MAEFSGIRNENEFYFAHYLTSLMDDELKEVCQTDEMKSAFEKVSKLGLEYHAVAAARDLVNRRRCGSTRQRGLSNDGGRKHHYLGTDANRGLLGYPHVAAD